MCTFLTLYKTNTVCQKIFYSLIETEAEQVPPPWKKLQLKLVTLTASSNTQTAHYQQNKNQDVPKKYPCCPQNICYTEYNQVYWLWKFIEFLQCFLEMRTVHCCRASNSTVCHVLLLHEKATEKSVWLWSRLQTAAQTFPRKEVPWRSHSSSLSQSSRSTSLRSMSSSTGSCEKRKVLSICLEVLSARRSLSWKDSYSILRVKLSPVLSFIHKAPSALRTGQVIRV